jgi:hypothetical protein
MADPGSCITTRKAREQRIREGQLVDDVHLRTSIESCEPDGFSDHDLPSAAPQCLSIPFPHVVGLAVQAHLQETRKLVVEAALIRDLPDEHIAPAVSGLPRFSTVY